LKLKILEDLWTSQGGKFLMRLVKLIIIQFLAKIVSVRAP